MDERTVPGTVGGTTSDGGSASGPRDAPATSPGDRIGRYVVVGRLGAGGMGEVFAAHDPRLDRRVAIKVLRERGERATSALVREARAVASLSHDNVVPIYDVGRHEGRVFVAMELVDGEDLGTWLGRSGLAIATKLRALVQAGRGLQAAHDAGLVHGDFKPANALVGKEGRVRVIDFGLARRIHLDTSTTDDGDDRWRGTPGYIAPEQYAGSTADPHTDQFAFCVSAWEAVFGVRPFTGESAIEIGVRVVDGNIDAPPRRSDVSARVEAALRRGLAADPRARWPTMNDLLHVLDAATSRSWSRAGIGSVALVSVVAWAAWPSSPRARCDAHEPPVHAVWSADARAAVEGALRQNARSRDTTRMVLAHIDAYVDQWAMQYSAICGAPIAEDDGADTQAQGVLACLDRRRRELQAVVNVLRTSEATSGERGRLVVAGLGSIDECIDPDALAGASAVPAASEQRIAELFERIAHCHALYEVGRLAEARSSMAMLAADIAAVDWAPLTIEYDILLSRWPPADETVDEAIVRVEAAFARALAIRDDRTAAELALDLAWQYGDGKSELERADHWLTVARSLLADGPDDHMLIAAAHNVEGVLRVKAQDWPAATAAFERAAQVALAHIGTSNGFIGPQHNLIRIDLQTGRNDRALERLAALRLHLEAEPGEDVEVQLVELTALTGLAHRLQGDLRAARRAYEGVVDQLRSARGERDPMYIDVQHGRAIVACELGEYEDCIALLREVMALGEAVDVFNLLADALLRADGRARVDEAERLATSTMDSGAIHSVQADAHAIRARVALRRGELERARAEIVRAEHVFAEGGALPDDRLRVDLAALEVAVAGRDIADVRAAISRVEESMRTLSERGRLPRVHLQLARAYWDFDVDRERARELAELAERELVARDGDPALLAEVRSLRARMR